MTVFSDQKEEERRIYCDFRPGDLWRWPITVGNKVPMIAASEKHIVYTDRQSTDLTSAISRYFYFTGNDRL